MSKVVDIVKNNFEAEVLKSDVPVLVDFWAPWCMPCRMMAPILDELAGELEGKIKIAKVDTENPENQELAIQYQIQSIPNMKLFKGGQVVAEFIGMRSQDALKQDLEKYL
ncbi:MAG TPA: thioredoxin [bacterium]|nr:MAG: Thioredoxin-1 [Parcubacteria group bacterium ADurb.Bin115]HNU81457.1 thioredoxin [bacterium]HOD87222.1 thioredoxin [bacterium]HPW05593.1 thioredoxin [bacterium]HQB76548.1 thioredoxin [bacterium]